MIVLNSDEKKVLLNEPTKNQYWTGWQHESDEGSKYWRPNNKMRIGERNRSEKSIKEYQRK